MCHQSLYCKLNHFLVSVVLNLFEKVHPSFNNNNNKLGNAGGKDEKSDDSILGVRVDFMRQSKLCFKFQSEVCDLESGHVSRHGVPLAHSCGFCLEKSGTVADHSTKSCPERAKGFGRGGGRGGSST